MASVAMTTTEANSLATKYALDALYAAVYTTTPTQTTQGTEPTGGSPAYARKAITWGAPSGGVITATVTFDIPTGTTLTACGVHTAVTGGTYLQGSTLTSQAFSSQGTYALTLTYTQS